MLQEVFGRVFAWDMDLNLSYPQIFISFAGLGLAYHWYYNKKYGYFKRRGIPGPTPIPVLGTSYRLFTEGILEMDLNARKKWGKLYGLYERGQNVLVVADREMLSEIFVSVTWARQI